jgi:protein TonB
MFGWSGAVFPSQMKKGTRQVDFSQGKANWSKRYTGLVVVALVHVLLVYIAITAAAHQAPEFVKGPLEIKMVKEDIVRPPENAPPPASPKKISVPLPFMPAPEIRVQQENLPNAIVAVSRDVPEQTPPNPQISVDTPQRAGTSTDVKAHADLQSCKPLYPPTALLFEEEGMVRVRFVVGADDQLKDVTILKSSGHKRLDNATVWGLSKCDFKAALRNGKPVESTIVTDYVWKIAGYDD